MQGSTNCGFAAGSGDADYIQNQNAGQQATSNFWISGTGRADTSITTPLLDTATAVALNIGTTNATSINLNKNVVVAANQSLTITGGNTASRPGSPTEGTMYYDTDTDQWMVYSAALGKWKAEGAEAILVAASNSSAADKAAADYIADGTGDQTEINSALTAADPAGAGRKTGKVHLFPGTYTIGAAISVPNNTTLTGAGNSTIIKLANGINATINAITNTDVTTGAGVSVRDLALDGNKANNSSGTQAGVWMENVGDYATNRSGAEIMNVEANNFRTYGIVSANSANTTIIGNTANANDHSGIVFSSNNLGTISGNIVNSNASYGIWLFGSNTIAASNNTTYANGVVGIYVQGGSNNTITGNAVTSGTQYGIYLNVTTYNTVTGNAATGNALGALYVLNGGNNILSANSLYNNGGATTNNAITINGADSNTISGNNINDTSCSANCYAINISVSTSDTNYLSANVLGNGTINDSGTGTVYGGQVNGSNNYVIQPASGSSIDLMRDVIVATATATDDRIKVSITTGGAARFDGTITNADLTAARTWTLPNESGTICTNAASGVCSTMGSYIHNQNAGQQATSNYWISGTGRADTGLQSPNLERASAGTLSVGTTSNTTGITLGSTSLTGSFDLNSGASSTINIGSSASARTINIGNVAAAQTITIGSASGGTIRLGQNGSTVQIDGTNFDVSTAGLVTLTGGIAGGDITTVAAATANGITIKPGNSTGSNIAGATLTLQGGNATSGNANGGNVLLGGGTGVGTGVKGLVVVDTATFTAATVQNFTGSANITQANTDSFGTILISSNASGYTATLTDPTITTAGRIVYVTNTGLFDMTLSVNGGGQGNTITLKPATTATMVWNGVDWTAAGASSATDLQAAYNNTLTSAGGAELVLNASGGAADGLTIRNNGTTPIVGGLLEVQSSIGTNLFSVNNFATEYASNGGAETSATFATNWVGLAAGGTVTRETATPSLIATGLASVKVVTAGATYGVKNVLSSALTSTKVYQVSFTAKLSTGSMSTLDVAYSDNGTTATSASCATAQSVLSAAWSKVTCTFTAAGTITADNAINIRQSDGTARNIYIDNLSVTEISSTTTPSNVQVGGGLLGGQPTLFTLDRFSSAPVSGLNSTYYGSMYYDTTTNRIQCYEADGWGACGSAPDNIITLTPEYTGAVLNGNGIGVMTADFCANETRGGLTFQVNHTTLCTTLGEARNYYRWTSPQATDQTYSIYVNYKLPSTFKGFYDDNTIKLTALKDHATNAGATLDVYRKNVTTSTITQCGSNTSITTGTGAWNQTPLGGSGETSCGFVAGDYVIFKITVTSKSNGNVYIENLDFTFSNT